MSEHDGESVLVLLLDEDPDLGAVRAALRDAKDTSVRLVAPTHSGPLHWYATDEDEARWPVPYWHLDVAMASLLILQTAVDEGLGACFFGIQPAQLPAVHDAFGIPATFDPIGAITLGHRAATSGAKGSPSRRPRKGTDEVVHRGRWAH